MFVFTENIMKRPVRFAPYCICKESKYNFFSERNAKQTNQLSVVSHELVTACHNT